MSFDIEYLELIKNFTFPERTWGGVVDLVLILKLKKISPFTFSERTWGGVVGRIIGWSESPSGVSLWSCTCLKEVADFPAVFF